MPKKTLAIFILCAVLLATGAAIYHFRSELAGSAQEQVRSTLKGKSGGDCWYANVCGDLAYYDCGADTDAPAYFVDLARKVTVGSCGGLCRGANAGRCQFECPPPGWSCDLNAIAAGSLPRLYELNESLAKERGLGRVLHPFDPPFPREGAKNESQLDPKPPGEAVFAAPEKGAAPVDEDGNAIPDGAQP